jgi:hypothetical protein
MKKHKKIKPEPVVFTTQNTGVDEILEELAEWSKNRSHENLHLEHPLAAYDKSTLIQMVEERDEHIKELLDENDKLRGGSDV